MSPPAQAQSHAPNGAKKTLSTSRRIESSTERGKTASTFSSSKESITYRILTLLYSNGTGFAAKAKVTSKRIKKIFFFFFLPTEMQ